MRFGVFGIQWMISFLCLKYEAAPVNLLLNTETGLPDPASPRIQNNLY